MLGWILDKLFPPRSVLCRKFLKKKDTDICPRCRTQVEEHPKGKEKLQFLDSWTSVWYYEDDVRESLLRFKFSGARHYASTYGRLLATKVLMEYPQGFDVLTWVPISAARKRSRGYDQGQLLAEAVSVHMQIPYIQTLKKIKHNSPQSTMGDVSHRRANVAGAYECLCPETVQGKRILLLDDILTTGATAGECARVLLSAGAKQVHCGVVAAKRRKNNLK